MSSAAFRAARGARYHFISQAVASSSRRCLSTTAPLSRTLASSSLPKPRIDYRAIAADVLGVTQNALNRRAALPPDAVARLAELFDRSRALQTKLNERRSQRAEAGKRVKGGGEGAIEEAKRLKAEVQELERELGEVDSKLLRLAVAIPNDTHPSSPLGPEPNAVTVSTHGPEPIPASSERDHLSIARALDLLDMEAAATTTGSSWYFLKQEAALLEHALINYALSVAVRHGFTPVTPPDVVKTDISDRCGFQPRDDAPAQTYAIVPQQDDQQQLCLAGTAEIPLAGLFANRVLQASALPVKVVGVGRAFRAEAGARGADTRGLYRVHQFAKVEMFVVSEAGASDAALEEIREIQEEIFNGLGLTFKVLDMPSEELGASAYRKYDMEAWMPGRGNWGEISSASNCTDYQARRLHIRAKSPAGEMAFAHTLNGTAAAVPRLILTLLENGARFDEKGNVVGLTLPGVLRRWWIGGEERVQWRD